MRLKQVLQLAGLSITITAVGGFAGCNPCAVEVSERAISPDGTWTATILTRECGATTSEYSAVNLQDTQQKVLDPKNEVFLAKHIHRLHVFWNGNDGLTIQCENCSADEVEKKIQKLGPIQITYHGA